jgi:uncharacterized protein (DUF1501 family)
MAIPPTPVDNYFPDLSLTNSARHKVFSQIQSNLLSDTYSNLMSQTLADTQQISIDAADDFNNAVGIVTINTPFETDGLSQRLKKIAQVIGARAAVGQRRQVFFVQLGGFDNHADLIVNHTTRMETLSTALSSFYAATEELNVANDVDSSVEAIDVGRGRLIPTTSVDTYYEELATWFGVSSGDLSAVLPNLGNFSGASPLNLFR